MASFYHDKLEDYVLPDYEMMHAIPGVEMQYNSEVALLQEVNEEIHDSQYQLSQQYDPDAPATLAKSLESASHRFVAC